MGGEGGRSSSGGYLLMQFLIFFTSLLLLLPSVLCFSNTTTFPTLTHSNTREAMEIGIGIGIGGGSTPPPESEPNSPPPPPPPPPPPGLQFVNELQRQAYKVIQRFKKTITCDPMRISRTWNGAKVCKYKGFYCETPPNRKNTPTIASVDFNIFHLCAPTVDNFINKLPDVALFHANSNNFSGTVPDLTGLQFLYELDVSNNNQTGFFPTNVLPLLNLTFLDLRFNHFLGTVPPDVFDIKLDVLFLNNNNFSERLPDNLGRTTAAYLTLANNHFTGPIPRSIGRASNTLLEVLFLNNELSGCLPYEVGLLKKATVFDAGTNHITGPIPLSFGCLKKVEQLNLAQNFLYGEVPDVVCRLADVGHLANLSLSSNYFTWLGTSCWRLLERGILDVRKNCIRGLPDQRSPAECFWFLKQPKYCPYFPHIPCRLPWKDGGAVHSAAAMLPAVGGGRDKAPASRYTTYTALHNRRRP
uniref:Uncharacterized protein At4g06744-like n=1 Tax=Elaeis guineensis var. tenera TaxID=51953 RepID=A0A8N4IAG0_ELAGV|nr:uncharacterized protein At4g06744-like [Elaeis guineensis]